MNKASARLSRRTLGFLATLMAFAGALISSSAAAQTSLAFEQQVTLPGSPFAVQTTADGHGGFRTPTRGQNRALAKDAPQRLRRREGNRSPTHRLRDQPTRTLAK